MPLQTKRPSRSHAERPACALRHSHQRITAAAAPHETSHILTHTHLDDADVHTCGATRSTISRSRPPPRVALRALALPRRLFHRYGRHREGDVQRFQADGRWPPLPGPHRAVREDERHPVLRWCAIYRHGTVGGRSQRLVEIFGGADAAARARAAVPNAAPLAAAGVSLKTAYLYAIVFSCRCTSQQLRRPLRRLLRRSGQSAAALRPPHLPCSHADEPAGFSSCTDLDLITMWFIELPEGTSLWEYTSVRTPRLQATLGRSACPSRGAVG